MTRLLTLAIALLPLGAWADAYVCLEDMATGFVYKDGAWRSVNFKPKEKFAVRPGKELEDWASIAIGTTIEAKWGVALLGDKMAIATCERDFDPLGNLYCSGGFTQFRMNRKSLQFLYVDFAGYTTAGEQTDTPHIAIGKCSQM